MGWFNFFFGGNIRDTTPPTDQTFGGWKRRAPATLIPDQFRLGATSPAIWLDGMVNVVDNGDISVEVWGGREPNGMLIANRFLQLTAGNKPNWNANLGYVDFDGGDYLSSGKDNYLSGATGRVMIVAGTVLGAANQVAFCCADAGEAATYMAFGVSGPANRIWMGFANEGVDDYQLAGNTILSEGVHLLEWYQNGDYAGMLVDNVEQDLSVTGSNAGKWFTDIASNGARLGALATSAGASLHWGGQIYELIAWNVDKRAALLTKIRNKLAAKYSITLS